VDRQRPEPVDSVHQRELLRLDPAAEAAEIQRQIPKAELRPSQQQLLSWNLEQLLAHPWFRELYGSDLGEDAPFVASLYQTLKEVREQRQQLETQLNKEIVRLANARVAAGELPGSRTRVKGELGLIMSSNAGTGWVGLPPEDHNNDPAYNSRSELRTWDILALDRLSHLSRTPQNERR
jgi:hypothetical protein